MLILAVNHVRAGEKDLSIVLLIGQFYIAVLVASLVGIRILLGQIKKSNGSSS